MRVTVLSAVGDTALRDANEMPLMGFLMLVQVSQTADVQLAFVARSQLTATDLAQLNALSSHSGVAPLALNVREMMAATLDQVEKLHLAHVLTLSFSGASVCPLALTIELANGATLPQVYFEQQRGRQAPTADMMVEMFGQWLERVHRHLVEVTQPGNESNSRSFELKPFTPSSVAQNQQDPSRKWSVSQDSSPVVKLATDLGNLSFKFVSSILGRSVANTVVNRIEDVTWDAMDKFAQVTRVSRHVTDTVYERMNSSPDLRQLVSDYDSAAAFITQFISTERRSSQTPLHLPQEVDTTRSFHAFALKYPFDFDMEAVDAEEWQSLQKEKSLKEIQEVVFVRGITQAVRKDVWLYLLLSSMDKSKEQRISEYQGLKNQWQTIMSEAPSSPSPAHSPLSHDESAGDEKSSSSMGSKMRERKHRIEKDVVRTDRNVEFYAGTATDVAHPFAPSDSSEQPQLQLSPNLGMLRDILVTYALYDFDLGYVQGMNDLLAPLLYVIQDETDTFWAFTTWMSQTRANFARDQSGMHRNLRLLHLLIQFMDPFLYAHFTAIDAMNLFCCFRWLLVAFKREFQFEDIFPIWECFWTCPNTAHFNIFLAFSILNVYREQIMRECKAFDELLKFINDRAGVIQPSDILYRAKVLCMAFQQEYKEYVESTMQLQVDIFEFTRLSPLKSTESDDFVVVDKPAEGASCDEALIKARSDISKEDILEMLVLLGH